MKRGFIRAFWGVYDDSHRITKRKRRIEKDVEFIKKAKNQHDFVVYVMGKENYDFIKSLGFKCVWAYKDPYVFDMIKHQYRNKLELINYAFEEDKYDELIYLDWDCHPKKKIDNNLFNLLGKKEKIQANLQQYKVRKCLWRKEDQRKVPNGGFLYIRDKNLVYRTIKHWEARKCDSDEIAFAQLTDEMVGGWKGKEKYWELFEPMYVNLHCFSAYDRKKVNKKDLYFKHYQGGYS